MSVQYDYLRTRSILLMKYFGRTTHRQQAALFADIHSTFGVGPFVDSLSDMSGITSSTLDGVQMFAQASRVTREVASVPSPIKQALYAPTDLSYGIAHMYMGFADLSPNLSIQIFGSMEAAIDWMGLNGTAETLFKRNTWRLISD